MDEEGYLFLEGRADDVIVRGGENLSPGEIEDVLLTHPAVADAAVVGVPDEQWGEAVAAAVVAKSGATIDMQALRTWLRISCAVLGYPPIWRFGMSFPTTRRASCCDGW